jgi:hypothetical protein
VRKEDFFFAKKKQKTLTTLPLPASRLDRRSARRKKPRFFGSFLQKRTDFL